MNEQVTAPVDKPKLKGVEIVKALLERQRFISNHLTNGGTFQELRDMGFKFGHVDLSNTTSGKS